VGDNALLRSTSVRLSLVYAGLVIASFVLVGLVMWLIATHAAEKELRQHIALEVAAIRTEFETEGLEPTIAAIDARVQHPGALEYWFATPAGERLAGDFPGLAGSDGWRRMTVTEGTAGAENREEMLIFTAALPGGARLSVGDDLGRARAVQNTILETLALVGTAAVLLCLAVGLLATRTILSRIRALSTTFERVTRGDITARYPVSGSPSDIEQIGVGVNRMLDRIEELVTDVRRVSRDVAHDLRTPLTHLQHSLEQARAEERPDERSAAIDAANQKAAEILRIFDAIVRLAEIDAGTGKLRFADVDLGAILDRVVDAYRPDVEEAGHSLETVDLWPCVVHGDEDLLAQAVANLLENAMRHTPPGTAITVRMLPRDSGRGFEIADNGPGVPETAYGAIRKPFLRLEQSRTTPGPGLGLSLVAAIARLHDAELHLANAGPGLSARFEFPRKPLATN